MKVIILATYKLSYFLSVFKHKFCNLQKYLFILIVKVISYLKKKKKTNTRLNNIY